MVLQGRQLSTEFINATVEANVRAAFAAIHKHNVIHGDIRRQNVLLLEDESVRIVDFETSYIAHGDVDERVREEDKEVACLIQTLKGGCDFYGRDSSD